MSPRSPITTHILDTSRGKPAANLAIHLEIRISETEWKSLKHSKTNAEGRAEDLLSPEMSAQPGIYRLTFDTASYYQLHGVPSFYPSVTVIFKIIETSKPNEHYHVPLLLSPYGYSTYRGA